MSIGDPSKHRSARHKSARRQAAIAVARRLAVVLVALAGTMFWGLAQAQVPPERLSVLRRGINLVHWFRFPPDPDDPALRSYIADRTLLSLRRAGFTFLRIPIQPELLQGPDGRIDPARIALVAAQLRRVEDAGLAVMAELHPQTWHLETAAADRARLVATWVALAPALRGLDPRLTFPEILNEPVFPDSAAWEALQARALTAIRAALPAATVVLSGTHWSDIDGLLQADPPPDRNTVYAVHFYEPYLLTVGAPEDKAADPLALGRLPFPSDTPACAAAVAAEPPGRTGDLMRYYCSLGYDEAAIRRRFAQAAEWSARTHVHLVFNEFGISPRVAPASRLAWLAAVRRTIEADGFGWAIWGYDDSMGFDLPITAAAADSPLPPAILAALGLR